MPKTAFASAEAGARWPRTACLDRGVASAIERTKGVKQEGVRAGNWLLKEQANELLNAPDPSTLKGKRDCAILAPLISYGPRRAELVASAARWRPKTGTIAGRKCPSRKH